MKQSEKNRDPDLDSGLLSRLLTLVHALRDWLLVQLKRRFGGPSQDTQTAPETALPESIESAVRAPDQFMARLLAGEFALQTTPAGRKLDGLLPAGEQRYSRARQYRVYIPEGLDPDQQLPLVVVLHGCHQTHLDIQGISGFDNIADREKFVVVYPYVTGFTGLRNINCWGWWLKNHRERDKGEVADIMRVVDKVVLDHPVDESRVHICGLSSGAGMSVASLVAYSDRYASGASVAGLAYAESARAVRISRYIPVRHTSVKKLIARMRQHLATPTPPPLLILQSTTDKTVDAVCAQQLLECWAATSDVELSAEHPAQGSVQGVPWNLDRFVDGDQRLRIMQLMVDGVDHGWLGGNPGPYSTPQGPVIAELIWWFFQHASTVENQTVPDGDEQPALSV